MQILATGVGDLKRVLSNVKARGTWGEVQLATLPEQVLAPDQYAATSRLATPAASASSSRSAAWAQQNEARLAADRCQVPPRGLPGACSMPRTATLRPWMRPAPPRARVKLGKGISTKYPNPPQDDGLRDHVPAERGALRRGASPPGLADLVQRDASGGDRGADHAAGILTSLQMGFRTLAIERRSSEVWALLGRCEDRVRQVRRGARWDPQEPAPSQRQDR